MEGVAGVVSFHQLVRQGFEYERAREWLTAEVNVVCEAAFAAGIDEIVIADSHYEGLNLLVEKLPEGVEVARHWPRVHNMMEGVEDGDYDGAILHAHHGGADLTGAGVAHTLTFIFKQIRINGVSFGETELSAATAGHYGVPVIMVSGDDVYVDHARKSLGDVETVVTRKSFGMFSGRVITPQRSRKLLAEAVARAISRIGDFRPFVVENPLHVELELTNHVFAETLCYLKAIKRVDSHTVAFEADDIVDVTRFLAFTSAMQTQPWTVLQPGGRK
jgi:D-amino peptidase